MQLKERKWAHLKEFGGRIGRLLHVEVIPDPTALKSVSVDWALPHHFPNLQTFGRNMKPITPEFQTELGISSISRSSSLLKMRAASLSEEKVQDLCFEPNFGRVDPHANAEGNAQLYCEGITNRPFHQTDHDFADFES